jgi:hypothetical protein
MILRPFELSTCWYPKRDVLDKLFVYNPDTGLLLNKIVRNHKAPIGVETGWLRDDGYRQVCINYDLYEVHRICFYLVNDYYPIQVDHINQIHNDNRGRNLRAAQQSENEMNKKLTSRNTSGVKGLSIEKRDSYTYWNARVTKNGITESKLFPFDEEGREQGIEFLKKTRREMHGEFAYD